MGIQDNSSSVLVLVFFKHINESDHHNMYSVRAESKEVGKLACIQQFMADEDLPDVEEWSVEAIIPTFGLKPTFDYDPEHMT